MHACYLVKRTYHKGIKKTPEESWGGHQPDLTHTQMFGTPVTVKKLGNHPFKTHPLIYHDIFLQYTRTDKNIVYYNITPSTIEVATHKTHNELVQYSSDKLKYSHAFRYIGIELIANDKEGK